MWNQNLEDIQLENMDKIQNKKTKPSNSYRKNVEGTTYSNSYQEREKNVLWIMETISSHMSSWESFVSLPPCPYIGEIRKWDVLMFRED